MIEHNYNNCHNITCRRKCQRDGYIMAIEEFVERLIGRLEEETIALEDNFGELVECIPKDIAISIVNQLAEEYKGGWIPCSERLPEEIKSKRSEKRMKENTRIITVEITGIEKGEEGELIPKEKVKRMIEEDLKAMLGADHVIVTNVQDFVRDV